jgi:hypothetical protein
MLIRKQVCSSDAPMSRFPDLQWCSRALLPRRLSVRANFAADMSPVARRISIRNAIGQRFSPVFMRLVAGARIEALFLDT